MHFNNNDTQSEDTLILEDELIDSEAHVPLQRSPLVRLMTLLGSGLLVGVLFSFLTYSYVNQEEGEPLLLKQEEPIAMKTSPEIFRRDQAPVVDSTEETIHKDLIIDLGKDSTESGISDYIKGKKIKIEQRKFVHTAHPGSGKLYAPKYAKPKKYEVKSDTNDGSALRLNPIPNSERFSDGETNIQWQSGFSVNNPEKNIRIGEAYKGYIQDEYGKPMVGELSSFEKGQGDLLDAMKNSTYGPRR